MAQLRHDMKAGNPRSCIKTGDEMRLQEGDTLAVYDKTAREQFIEDFILVTDNDRDSYEGAREIVQEKETLSEIAEEFQEQFEGYIQQVAEREEALGHEAGALLIRQMLTGWGDDAFRAIARHYMETE
jgi:hypothetical protein